MRVVTRARWSSSEPSLWSRQQDETGKQADKEGEPRQWRMPDEAIEAERRCQSIEHEEQRDRRQEIKQKRGNQPAEEVDFTQHRIVLLRSFDQCESQSAPA